MPGPRKGGGGGGGDTVLESRHVLGLFLGVVVLCGVFFTLGYVMGRTQSDSSVRAAASRGSLPPAGKPGEKSAPAAPAAGEWQFYRSREAKKAEDRLEPPARVAAEPEKTAGRVASAAPASGEAKLKPPLMPRGAIVLQVAALSRESDAYALAEALQKKEFPAFVLLPAGDSLHRVQVGPYADQKSAEGARRLLEREGFKAITKP